MSKEEVKRGQAATKLLEHPLMVEAMETIDSALTDLWLNSKSTEDREEIWYTLQGAKRFRNHLQIVIETGEYVEALEDQENE